jgi:predicted Zn finger-like uncharacterized protein
MLPERLPRMRIVCPSCSAAYEVPDSLVTAGRTVRCARCGGEWMPVQAGAAEQEPEMAPMDAPPSVFSEPAGIAMPQAPARGASPIAEASPRPSSAMDRLAVQSTPPSSRLRLRLAWLASLVLLALLCLVAYAWRADIVDAWPPSARMYAAFGMRPPPGRAPQAYPQR